MLGICILILIVIIYVGSLILLYVRQNPQPGIAHTKTKSRVTHSHIGKRGDMGNQIFQLACLIAAGTKSNAEIILPTRISSLGVYQLFDLSAYHIEDVIVDENFYEYDNYEDIIIPSDGKTYNICGYRQAYRYFDDHAHLIRAVFTPKVSLIEEVQKITPPEYIAIHIRRGDYIKMIHKVPLLREFRQCQLDYYKAAVKILRDKYPNIPLLVCTDSPSYIVPLLKELDSNAMIAPICDDVSPKFTDFITLYKAKALAISNSTYSWMSAYLQPGRLVICPTPWWDPDGFIGTALSLSGPYLHHPDWLLLNADTGSIIRQPHSSKGNLPDNQHETVNMYRLIRGLLV